MTSVSIEVEGLNKIIGELRKLEDAGEEAIEEVIFDLVSDTHQIAVAGVQKGPATGRVYEKYSPRRTHRASGPGEYPMSDTGNFASTINAVYPSAGNLTGMVGTGDKRGPWFEFGTSKMRPRPWLLRSFERAQIGLEQELKRRLEAKT
jgi:hypothetical protein